MSSAQLTESPSGVTPPPFDDPAQQGGGGGVVRILIVVLVIAAAVGGAVWKIRSNKSTTTTAATRMTDAASRPLPVLVTPVVQKTMPIYLTALGTVTPYYSVTIKSRVDGQLMSVNVREGQSVHKGQLLAQIDPAPYEAALAQAQGQLVKDQANAKNAEAEAQRYTALQAAGVVSTESQQLQVSAAGQAAGSLAADQAAIQAARVNLAYTKISSPIDGVVGLRQVDPGNIVHASDATGLLLVTQLQPIAVLFTLPEDQLPDVLHRVHAGQKLPVEAYDRSAATHLASGTVLTLDNQIDSTTGTDKVKAVFPNRDGALFPNQFVNVRLILQQRPDALVVPASAIQTGSQGNFVFLMKQGMPPGAGGGRRRTGGAAAAGGASAPASAPAPAAQSAPPAPAGGAARAGGRGGNGTPYYVVAQPVTVDVTEGADVIIASGLKPGDQVVIDGQEKLLDGSRVTPRTPDQLPGAGGGRRGQGAAGSAAAGTGAAATSADTSAPAGGHGQHTHGAAAAGAQPADAAAGPHRPRGAHAGQQP
jgi:multidrug efflux system membrane fusion protein